ncbi:uncharacterized protein LOC132788876 [Drosophila nasuta]|uniref:uncharacterized protein LOC132788876 n=1 Tax=Drosophila nasuta TaxID=42062 RepID=UPI00295E4764|nr:uncharacterized protein LOC132788876 [Drosophila nasuta]
MSVRSSMNQDYTIISRWMHKTLVEWQNALKDNGSITQMYEEYIDFTNNADHFKKFINLLCEYCPNLSHVRLVFSGEINDVPEDGLVEAVLRLPNVQCLTLIDAPSIALFELQNDSNQLTTLNLCGVDKKIKSYTNSLGGILGSMKKLHSLVYSYKDYNDQIVESLAHLPNLKALTLLYLPRSEFLQLKNCKQLEVLYLYNTYEKVSTKDFLDVFSSMRNLHTLSIVFLEENMHLTKKFYKLREFCPQLTCLTLNCCLDCFGDFAKLKYLKIDDDSSVQLDKLLTNLRPIYANRLQILDISEAHANSTKITKFKNLKGFLCGKCPKSCYSYFSKLLNLQFLSFEIFEENLSQITKIVNSCSQLRYLRLPLKIEEVGELVKVLPDILSWRSSEPDDPFVLSLGIGSVVGEIEDKLKMHPHGNLLQLDWNGMVFTSKLKELIASLGRNVNKETAMKTKTIFQNPCKMAGDGLSLGDRWMSNANYKLALKSCSKKFNLEYDEELINRCRNKTINNTDYELSNQIDAFNFKYDALDEHNEL